MPPSLILRDARPDEAAALVDVTLAAYQQYAAFLGEHWELYRKDIVQALTDPGPVDRIVAEAEGQFVGSVLLYHSGTERTDEYGARRILAEPEVRLLGVLPAARGQGIGKVLMQECIRRARVDGSPALGLHTHEIMAVAMSMYERMGFVRNPAADLHPVPDIIIKAYRLVL